MKELLPWILLAALTGSWLLDRATHTPTTMATMTTVETTTPAEVPPGPTGQVFALDDLRAQLEESGRAYLPFLNEPTLRTGLYALPAGGEDRQQPHDKDEVYYVIQGRAQITIDGETYEVEPGSVIFVAAHAEHRFHDIEVDLQLLVFFSEATPQTAD